ncbi:MAG: WXG100 family type VII secretion target [Nocardioides sp.]|nr:WXG100 family type VII secretion target [Nocardioides sp.]
MAHDFGASYSEMESAAGKLADGKEQIEDTLKALQDMIDTLLGDDFKTQHASGKFGEGYTELTNGLKSAIVGITDMGDALKNMVRAIQETDQALAGN